MKRVPQPASPLLFIEKDKQAPALSVLLQYMSCHATFVGSTDLIRSHSRFRQRREKILPNSQQAPRWECSSSALTWELCTLWHSSQESKTCLQAFLLTLPCSGVWEQDTAPPTPQRGQQTWVSFSLSFMAQSHLAHSWGRCLLLADLVT